MGSIFAVDGQRALSAEYQMEACGRQTARIVGGMPDGGCPLSRWTQWRGLQGGKSAKTFNTMMHEFYRRVSDTATGVEVSRSASNVIFLPIDSD
ncbi:hypothetical protein K438DRAFT_1983076 [Mycena galopus ATCC 62051]|nr:hypothetical protein K438DRAFT_1983076 [Mycena galopus ATCC 62051]